jgi:hypothetical protein
MPRTNGQAKRKTPTSAKTPAKAKTPTRAPSRHQARQGQRDTSPRAAPESRRDVPQGPPTIVPAPGSQEAPQARSTTPPAPREAYGPAEHSQVHPSPPQGALPPQLAEELTAVWPELQALAHWWQERHRLVQEDDAPDRQLVRQTYHIEQRYIEAVKREADRTGESYAAVVNRAFARYFAGR